MCEQTAVSLLSKKKQKRGFGFLFAEIDVRNRSQINFSFIRTPSHWIPSINDKVIFMKRHLKISMNFMLTYFSSMKKKKVRTLVSFVGEKKYLVFDEVRNPIFTMWEMNVYVRSMTTFDNAYLLRIGIFSTVYYNDDKWIRLYFPARKTFLFSESIKWIYSRMCFWGKHRNWIFSCDKFAFLFYIFILFKWSAIEEEYLFWNIGHLDL